VLIPENNTTPNKDIPITQVEKFNERARIPAFGNANNAGNENHFTHLFSVFIAKK